MTLRDRLRHWIAVPAPAHVSGSAPDPDVGPDVAALDDPALTEALALDPLLLDEQAQRVAAGVEPDRPFGRPAAPAPRRGPFRVGFTAATGALVAVGLAGAVVALQRELLLVAVAVFIAVGIEPAVEWLTRHGFPRALAVLTLSVVVVGAIAAFLAAAVPPLIDEATQLIRSGPQFLTQLQDKHTVVGRLNAQFHLQDKLVSAADKQLSLNSVGGLLSVGQTIVSYTFEVVVVLVLVVYLLADFPGLTRTLYRLVPLSRRPRVALLTDGIIHRTGGYILGNLLTSLIATIAQYAVLRALGVPYALVLSVFVGLFDLIPLVGSTVANVLVTIVALAAVSVTAAVVNAVFALVYRVIEDYVIGPRVLRRTVDVRPLVTVLAVVLGGSLLGIVGALLAVPAAAAVQLVITEVVYPRMDADGAAVEPDAADPSGPGGSPHPGPDAGPTPVGATTSGAGDRSGDRSGVGDD